ncbi:MAG: serine hydrolase domain-containing protein [Vulcanimicrobiota bacterium]
MKVFWILFSLLIFCLGGCGRSSVALAQPVSSPEVSPTTFTDTVTALREKHGARAVLAGVWQGEQEIAKLALGPSMTGVPATTDMTVRIGGISQLFMGTLVMRLAEKGHFSLDDKISKWLPDLFQADQVTIGMLIRNMGGYRDHVRDEAFGEAVLAQPFRQFSPEELVELSVQDGQSNFPPGSSQQYSHTEFIILRMVLEKATGRSMPELYQQEVLDPLGLTRTGYGTTPELPSPVLHAFTSDRGVYEDCTFWNPSWAGDSGPLYSTLDDLGQWGPAFGRGQLLSNASFQELVKRPATAPPGDFYFACGFVVAGGWYFQNPNINGYSGVMGYLPERDLTVVVFATQPEKPQVEHPAKEIFLDLVDVITPNHPLRF